MVAPAAGRVVLVPFPFSDLSQAKLRLAIVLADAARPGKLFTASRDLMVAEVAVLTTAALQQVVDAVAAIIRGRSRD